MLMLLVVGELGKKIESRREGWWGFWYEKAAMCPISGQRAFEKLEKWLRVLYERK